METVLVYDVGVVTFVETVLLKEDAELKVSLVGGGTELELSIETVLILLLAAERMEEVEIKDTDTDEDTDTNADADEERFCALTSAAPARATNTVWTFIVE